MRRALRLFGLLLSMPTFEALAQSAPASRGGSEAAPPAPPTAAPSAQGAPADGLPPTTTPSAPPLAAPSPNEPVPGVVSEAPQPSASPSFDPNHPVEFPGMVQGGVVSSSLPPPARPWPTQRNFALAANAGAYSGFGFGFRAGAPRVGIDASFGYLGTLATYSPNRETFPKFRLLSGYEASASVYVGFYRPDPRTDLGISFGYKYSSLLRHGVGVAFYLQRELSAHWTVQVFVGPAIFPEAERQIRAETGWTHGSVLSGMAWHQGGLGVSLAFFP